MNICEQIKGKADWIINHLKFTLPACDSLEKDENGTEDN